MMRCHRLTRAGEDDVRVYGATMARNDLRPLVEGLVQTGASTDDALDVVLDFTGIVSATSSYLKRTILWLYDCARLAAEGGRPEASEDPAIPLNIYVFTTGLTDEVRAELREVLRLYNRTCLEVPSDAAESLCQALVLGPLDLSLRKTLDALVRRRAGTATELHQAHASDHERITVNAWNNRLSDLFCKRLARRSKEGRHWVYEPVLPEVQTYE
jgi:hypothetical protein